MTLSAVEQELLSPPAAKATTEHCSLPLVQQATRQRFAQAMMMH
jgi:hypothetical protein